MPVNTAGAGDCFLGVVLAALAHEVPLQNEADLASETVCTAPQLARIAAEIKIQCKDTIHFGINAAIIKQEILDLGLKMSEPVRSMLGG